MIPLSYMERAPYPPEWDFEGDELCCCDDSEYGKTYTRQERQNNKCNDCGLPLFNMDDEK